MEALLRQIAHEIESEGGTAYFIGGWVRDHLMGQTSKDIDIEVYGLELDRLENLLARFGRCEAVGRSFGVLKLFSDQGWADFSLPRRESKVGRGHRGFMVDLDPGITPEEACSRRDFTVNAMMLQITSGELLDFFGGQADIEAGILRHVGPAFVEDPLRVYRLMRFAGCLEMQAWPQTLELCRDMDLWDLAPERIFSEFEKLLLEARQPSRGLETARQAGILAYHPELEAMVDCPQDPQWHPEGDVWTHTLMVVDEAAKLRENKPDRHPDQALMFGALCHDMGKPLTTRHRQGRILSPGHAEAGAEPARRFLGRMTQDRHLLEEVEKYVLYHLRPAELYRVRDEVHDSAVRRLALRVRIADLVRWARADHLGRGTPDARRGEFPAGDWLLAKAAELEVRDRAPRPLLMGRHLLERGWREGPTMGALLEKAYEAQLEGTFGDLDGALDWLADEEAPDRENGTC